VGPGKPARFHFRPRRPGRLAMSQPPNKPGRQGATWPFVLRSPVTGRTAFRPAIAAKHLQRGGLLRYSQESASFMMRSSISGEWRPVHHQDARKLVLGLLDTEATMARADEILWIFRIMYGDRD
jgi:hypothetical protein